MRRIVLDSVFLPCQEKNMIEMNVSEAHCSAAMGGVGDTSCKCVCVLILCILWAPVWLSVWRVHTFVWGRRREEGGAQKESIGARERQRFGRSLRGCKRLWSSFCRCVCVCGEETLPWQYIRCLAGAVWPAKLSPHLHLSLFCSMALLSAKQRQGNLFLLMSGWTKGLIKMLSCYSIAFYVLTT